MRPQPRFASLFSPLPPATTLTATKTDNLAQSATVNPGDTIMYTVEIMNTGGANATNVMFTDTVDPNTTLDMSSIKISPIAVDDTYHTIGNVNISVAAPGLLGNDLNPGGMGTLAVTQVNGTNIGGSISTTHGSVTMNADGSFTYNPTAGFAGPSDSFTYTLGNGTGKTDTATVTINISGLIWFVDNSYVGATSDGRLGTPFKHLVGGTSPLSGTVANDVIFIYTGSGSYVDTGTLTLTSGEKVIGQGANQSIETITGFTTPSGSTVLPSTGGTNPIITGSNITAFTLNSNNGLHGFTVGDTGTSGVDIAGSNFGNLTVKKLTLNGSGEAMNLFNGTIVSGSTFDTIESTGGTTGTVQGLQFSQVGGGLTATTTNIVNPNGVGIDIQNSPNGSSFNFGSTTVNKNSTSGIGVDLATNGTTTFTFSSLAVTTNSGTGVSVTSSGTVNVTTGSITSTGGSALGVSSTALGMTFTSVSSTNSTGTGINLTSASGSLSITTTTITNPSGIGITETSSGATVNYGDATVNGSGGTGVVLGTTGNGNTGTITFGTLNIAPDAGQRGLLAQDNTNTITTTSGAITSATNTAVEITRSSLTTPLNVTLTSVTSNSSAAPNGIILTNTSGSFTIAGTGTSGSGGTISNKTGADGSTTQGSGIYINNATNVSLNWMQLHDFQNFGIRGFTVTGFTLANCTVNTTSGFNGTSTALDEGTVSFDNMTGTCSITNSTISDALEANARIVNTTGTLTLTVTGSTFSNNDPTNGLQGLLLQAGQNAGDSPTITANVTTSTFTNNRARHLQGVANSAGVLNINIGTTGVAGSGGSFTGMPAAMVDIAHNSTANSTFTIRNATFNVNVSPFASVPINIFNGSASGSGTTFQGQIANNSITAGNNSGFDGISLTGSGPGTFTVAILNNTVTNVAGNGINYTGAQSGSNNTANLMIKGNTVTMPDPNAAFGIQVSAAAANPSTNATVCAEIGGSVAADKNTVHVSPGPDIRVDSRFVNSVMRLPGYAGGAQDTAAVKTFVSGNNITDANSSADISASVGLGPGSFVGGAACTAPVVPASADFEPMQAASVDGNSGTRRDSLPNDADELHGTLRAARGEGHNEDIQKLRQEELAWLAQAALQRWREAGISDQDLARLEAATFELADLSDGEISTVHGSVITIDETGAGYGWFFDQTPANDFEFDVPVPGMELQTTESSPAHNRMDLLSVLMRQLGFIYLKGKDSVPTEVQPLMQPTLSPAVRRLPDISKARTSISRLSPAVGQPSTAQIASTAPSQPKTDSVASQPKGDPSTSLVDLKPAVFNPSADLMPGSYGRSARRMSYAPGARTAAALNAQPFTAGTVGPLNLGTIPPGEKVTIMFSVTVNDPVPANTIKVCNQGQVSADTIPQFNTDDPDTVTPNDSTCTNLNVADIAVTKTGSPTPNVNAGNNITYTVTVTNTGPAAAKNVTLSDAIPANTTFVSTTTPANWNRTDSTTVGGTGTLTFSRTGDMPNADVATFTIVVKVGASTTNGATISNTATATTTSPNPTANDSATAMTTVQTSADLAVTKSGSPTPNVNAGSNITYTINFTNNGPSDAQTVTVTDATPANTTFVSASVTTGTGWSTSAPSPGGTGNVVFSKATVAAGETAVFTVVVNVNANATNNSTITNNATAASTTSDPNSANNTGTAMTNVIALADLAVTKSGSPTPNVFAGNNITYTINFQNNGPATAGSVTVTDATPANTTFVSATVTTGTGWSTSAPSVGGTGNVVFSKASVPNGETAVFTIVVKVNSNTTSGTTITNSATAATSSSDPDSSNNTATAMTNVQTQADLALTKSDSPDPVNAGANITYTINFVNNGPSDAQTVTVTDAVPAGTTFVSASVTTGSGWSTSAPSVGGTGNVVFSKATVAAGETAVFSIVVKVPSNTVSGSTINNTATAATTTTDPTSSNDSASAQTTVNTAADLAVTKSDSPDPVTAGSNITYTINFANNGPSDAQTVTVTDAVPANCTFVSASVMTGTGWSITAPSVGGTGNVVFSKGTVVAGETAVFTMVVKVSASTANGTTISNSATAASATTDPTPANNTGMASTTVQASADLAVTKTDAPDPVFAGANITYTINFTNNGPSDAQTVTVTDATPANTTFVSATVTTGSGWSTSAPSVGGTGNVVFSKSPVAAGETAVFTVVVKVNSNTAVGTTITNNATAATTTTDPTSGNNTGTATTTVAAQADLAVTKSDSPDPVIAGNNLTYTINFANNGPSDASTVSISDAVPANTTFVSATVTTGTGWSTSAPAVGGTGNVVFSKAMVLNGETAVFTIVVKVNANTPNGTTLSNTATAAATSIDPTSGNNSATETTTVNTSADLAVTKSDSPDPVIAGQNITYTINFVNNGPSDAQTVTVTDAVPANTTFVSASVTTGIGWGASTPALGGTGNVVFSKSTVAAGETAVFQVIVKVNSSAANGSTITNNAVAASTTSDPTSGNNTGTATTTVNTQADIQVTKSGSPTPNVNAGANLTYTINFTNAGPSDAQTVTLTDAVPANTTFVSATVTTGTGWSTSSPAVGGTGNVVFSKASVAAGESAVFTIVVKVNSNTTSGTTISNTATAATTTTDPTPANNSAMATTNVQVSADLAVTKTDSPDPVIATQNLTYTINFVNNGPSDAQTVTVTDTVPANTTFVSASVTSGSGWSVSSPPVGSTGTNVVFSKATVVGGETAVFTIVVNVNGSTPNNTIITNSATAASPTPDPNSGNNTGTATTTVIAQADLAVSKSASPDPVCVNGNITYTINFTNNGPGPGISTTVTDAVPANTTFVSASVTSGSGWSTTAPAVGGTGNVVFSKGSTASGETATFQIVVKVNSGVMHGTVITNMATAASTIPDPTPGNNTGTTTTTVDPIPPTISCPSDVTATGAASCPFATGKVVTFANPTVNDNCPGATVACNPPSGSTFPAGTTTVTCTATDTAGNMSAPCTFTVTVFPMCLQDETNPGNFVLFDPTTGNFQFFCNGVLIASGTGTPNIRGCGGTIMHAKGERRVTIVFDTTASNGKGSGTATVSNPPSNVRCQILDKDMSNNTCSASGPVAAPERGRERVREP